MSIALPRPPLQYDYSAESQRNSVIERELRLAYKRLEDVELGGGQRLILRSPDGTRWAIEVDDMGALSASSI